MTNREKYEKDKIDERRKWERMREAAKIT